jgi:hypothetical protein
MIAFPNEILDMIFTSNMSTEYSCSMLSKYWNYRLLERASNRMMIDDKQAVEKGDVLYCIMYDVKYDQHSLQLACKSRSLYMVRHVLFKTALLSYKSRCFHNIWIDIIKTLCCIGYKDVVASNHEILDYLISYLDIFSYIDIFCIMQRRSVCSLCMNIIVQRRTQYDLTMGLHYIMNTDYYLIKKYISICLIDYSMNDILAIACRENDEDSHILFKSTNYVIDYTIINGASYCSSCDNTKHIGLQSLMIID